VLVNKFILQLENYVMGDKGEAITFAGDFWIVWEALILTKKNKLNSKTKLPLQKW